MSVLRVPGWSLPLSFVILAACSTSPDGPYAVGDGTLASICDSTDDCQTGLLCAYGFCRATCVLASDCAVTESCVPVEGSGACVPTGSDAGLPLADAGSDASTQQPNMDAGSDASTSADSGAMDSGASVDSGVTVDSGEPQEDAEVAQDGGEDSGDGSTAPGSVSNGDACGSSQDCKSGHCTDGVCCDLACTGTCLACVSAKTDYPNGVCAPVLAGSDPDSECVSDPSSCGAHLCNGSASAPACRFWSSATQCAVDTCVDGVATVARYCSGTGTCLGSTSQGCGLYHCNAAGTACLTECAINDDCVGSYTCNASHKCVVPQTSASVQWMKS